MFFFFFFFSSRRRHTRLQGDWSSDVCSSDLDVAIEKPIQRCVALNTSLRQHDEIRTVLPGPLNRAKDPGSVAFVVAVSCIYFTNCNPHLCLRFDFCTLVLDL